MATTTAVPAPPTPVAPSPVDETSLIPKKLVRARPLFDPEILRRALKDSVLKLNPVTLMKNPVIFVVEVGAALVLLFLVRDIATGAGGIGFELQIDLWLWFTVLFATFAEAMAEARGKAQAESLRKTRTDTIANRLAEGGRIEKVSSSKLRAGDVVVCSAGEVIPGDGEVIDGIATVDESVITGESAPVIRESGGDRSAVTGGTRVLSDQIKIKITSNPGETFLDRMIALVEGAERQKTPNEIALNIMIAGLTIIFLFAVVTLVPYAIYSVNSAGAGTAPTIAVYTALLVCLIPTTIGGLLSAIGIAGMDRVMQHNVLAMSGKAVEAAGDVNTLLLDKTGTITLGSRQAVAFLPASGVTEGEIADAAQLSSLADETPEGRSIVVLAKEKYGLRGRDVAAHHAKFIPFSAYTKMSGVDIEGRQLRKGATDAIVKFVKEQGGRDPAGGDGALRQDLADRRHAARGGRRLEAARHHPPQGHRQGRHEGAHRAAPGHGHPLGDGHRRQPADGGGHCLRGRRGRLPRAGDAEGQARVHQEGAGGRPHDRDDRRRHQRRAGARAGRRRSGHEHRDDGGPRGRQHGGSRQQPDEADRGRRHRQAAAHHARRLDDVLDHERRLEVLRDHSGDVHGHVSGAEQAQHHVPPHAGKRRARGGDLQRADHRRRWCRSRCVACSTGRKARRRCSVAIC